MVTHMPASLLHDGLLENVFTLSCLYHLIDFLFRGFLACDCVDSPLNSFPAQSSRLSSSNVLCVLAARAQSCAGLRPSAAHAFG